MERSNTKRLPRSLWTALFHPWVWRMAWRDSRSQRLRLLVFSLAIVAGVAALTAIHSLKESVERGISAEAKSLLGSDLKISSKKAFVEGELAGLTESAEEFSRETSFPTMMRFQPKLDGGGSRLMQMRGVEEGYPFYGKVETRPVDAWDKLLAGGAESGVLLEPAVLDQFGVKVGDEIQIGEIRLRILGVVDKPAPRGSRFSGFAPEAYVRLADLESAGLLGAKSMANFTVHLQMAGAGSADELKEAIQEGFPESFWRIETPEDRSENLGDALDNFQQFLGLIALASLALGAIGVAGAVHAHITRRITTIAILRCLGCPGHLAFGIYLAQALALGLFGALLGAGLGIGMQLGLIVAFQDQLPVSVAAVTEWKIAGQTAAMGFAVCCGFALLPLLRIREISPAVTLRNGARLKGSVLRRLPVYGFLVALLLAVAYSNDPRWKSVLALVGGMLIAFLSLLVVAKLLMWLARKLVGKHWPYLLRQGISNLYRPGNQTLLFLLSLGLGTFLLVTVLSVGNILNDRLTLDHAGNSPNLYLIDVQPDQELGVREVLKNDGLPVLESSPMVTMRIESIRGVPVAEAIGVPKWVARREFRSSYRDYLNPTETLVAGKLATDRANADELVPISLEEKIAMDMGVGIGDEMTLDIQGVSIRTQVTSLRQVDWSQFNLNFFMIFPPGVLEDAPGFHVVTTRTPSPSASGDLQRHLADSYANVTAIDLTQILESIRDILGKISAVVSVLAGFTVLAGLPILIGTLLNGRDVRLKESMLLRTLGASGRQVRMILLIEYTTLGVLSALTGVLLAVVANAALAIFVFKADPWPDAGLVLGAVGIVTGISVLGGLLVSRGVTNNPPLEVLRGG